jgi:hypothetical protein
MSLIYSLPSIRPWRIKHTQHTKQLPLLSILLDSNSKRPESPSGKFARLSSIGVYGRRLELGQLENRVRSAFGASVFLAVFFYFSSDSFRDRVKGVNLWVFHPDLSIS